MAQVISSAMRLGEIAQGVGMVEQKAGNSCLGEWGKNGLGK